MPNPNLPMNSFNNIFRGIGTAIFTACVSVLS